MTPEPGGNADPRNLAIIGDVHLERVDDDLRAFLVFLDRLAATTRRIVLMGDLFNVWIGRRELERPHHRPVIAKLAELRARGIGVRYLEGNRDYRVGRCYAGHALDDASDTGLVERFGGHSIFAAHGDLANPRDLQYRAWRRISRSAPAWLLFHAIPEARRRRFADALEARMRSTNLGFKREFPEEQIRAYASRHLAAGHDAVVLGHFHVEKELAAEPPGPPGRIFVLPEWKESRRHLELRPDGAMGFVDS